VNIHTYTQDETEIIPLDRRRVNNCGVALYLLRQYQKKLEDEKGKKDWERSSAFPECIT